MKKSEAVNASIKIAEIIAPNNDRTADSALANEIADFIETLALRLEKIDCEENAPTAYV